MMKYEFVFSEAVSAFNFRNCLPEAKEQILNDNSPFVDDGWFSVNR